MCFLQRFFIVVAFCSSPLVFGQRTLARVDRILSWVDEHENASPEIVMDSLENALAIAEMIKSPRKKTRVLLYMSELSLRALNDIERCAELLNEIKKLSTQYQNDPWILSRYYNGLGVMYYKGFFNQKKALSHFKHSQFIIQKHHLKDDGQLLNNYALALMYDGDYQMALQLFKKSFQSDFDNLSNRPSPKFLIANNTNIALCYLYLDQLDSAEFYLQNANTISLSTATLEDDFSTLVYLGVFQEENGRRDRAFYFLNRANKLLSKVKSLENKILLCDGFLSLYKSQKDWEIALGYYEKRKEYSDALLEQKLSEQSSALDYKLEINQLKSDRDISALERSIEKQQAQVKLLILVVTIVLLFVFGGSVFYRIYKQKELNRLLAEKEKFEKESIKQKSEIDLLKREEALVMANVEIKTHKNELSDLKQKLEFHLNKSHDPEFDDLKHFLKQVGKTEKKVEQLKYLDHVLSYSNNRFYKVIKEAHPNFTEDEMRLALLIRLNLNSEEMMQVFNISMKSLMTKRYRLRKKIGLAKEESLEGYLLNL